MKTKIPFLFLTLLFAGFASAITTEVPSIQWRFDTSRDSHDTPKTSITLVVGHRAFAISREVVGAFHALNAASFREHGVPAEALAACSGWWAGAGDEYYVIRAGSRFAVYHRELSETADIPRYKLLCRINDPNSK